MIVTQKGEKKDYIKKFVPFGFAAFLIGVVGGFTTVLGPAFVGDLGLDYNNTTWTALAMAISTAAFAPISGKIADSVGKRKTLLVALAVFTLGNILTACATSLWFMLAARFIVGLGASAVAPVVMSFILTDFPRDKSARGFSLYMFISGVAVIFGPSLGGIITQNYGWRKMMWVCVGICVFVFVICLFSLEKDSDEKKHNGGFDIVGTLFVLLFFGLVLCIPSFGQNFGWTSLPFVVTLVLSAVTGVCLYFAEKKADNPVLQIEFIKRKVFILSVIALFLTQGLMQANMTDIILFVNYTVPQNAIISSYAISVMYVGMSLGSVFLGPLADRTEPKRILMFSLTLTGVGCAIMLLFSQNTSLVTLACALGVLGFGLGGNAAIFMKIVLSGVADETAGAGTGTYGLFRDLSAPFGVAVFVPLFTNTVTSRVEAGAQLVSAAVSSVRILALTEIICVITGIVIVMFLPSIRKKEEDKV